MSEYKTVRDDNAETHKVILMDKENVAEALTAPPGGKSIAIDNIMDLIYVTRADKSGYSTTTAYRVVPTMEGAVPLNKLWAKDM